MNRNYCSVKALFIFFSLLTIYCLPCAAFDSQTKDFKVFASDLKKHFKKMGWVDLNPEKIDWVYYRKTRLNRPLIFTSFGESTEDITIFLGGIHGDESPSVYIMFKLAEFLKENPKLCLNKKIVIAPLVNPDGFFRNPQTRTNSRGVDINRNFPTQDWRRAKKDRYYPGSAAGSENETRFQIALINRYKPSKIISVHSPLGFYDYDGPSSDLDDIIVWLKKLSKDNGLPFRRYRVYPGSLGNFAGVERKIHTLTIELPSSIPQHGKKYFDQFKKTLLEVISFSRS
jgi:protein MpaA